MTGEAPITVAQRAAQMIPAYARVLGIGTGTRALEPLLPAGCTYHAADAVPAAANADIAVLLGGAAADHDALSTLGLPFLCTLDAAGPGDAAVAALRVPMQAAGFRLQCAEPAASGGLILKWVPQAADRRAAGGAGKRVLVMSYYNTPNFGDRLGYHVLNGLLPADAEVTWGMLHPWTVPDRDYDLLILGIGNSLLANDVCAPGMAALLDRVPRAIGIFGTQYREQFHYPRAARALDAVLDRLTTWWARYEEDILAFGRGRANVRHLGDWLIAAFPMAVPTLDRGLAIPSDIIRQDVSLDRMIQNIHGYRAVCSARLHTLLCALTSADEVSYREQRGTEVADRASGKFRSMLYDIFGRTFDEDTMFPVDRAEVVRYKRRVEANLADLRAELFALLESSPAPGARLGRL